MSIYWLRVSEPGHPARVVTVDNVMDVGRDGHDLLLDDPTASRHHCKVEPADGGILVTDLGSVNGTRVDGQRIEQPQVVGPGSVIALGETELMVVQGHATKGESQPEAAVPIDPTYRASEAARDLNKASGKSGLGTFRKS